MFVVVLRRFTYSPTGERFLTRDCDNFPIQVNLEAVQREIRKAPTVDAVPVVRCRDCKFRFTSLCPTHNVEYDMENEPNIMWGIEEPDRFCSHGESIK